LQCHGIVEQFIKLDFKGHTMMVQQMTLYMMTEWVDPAQMVRQAATVEAQHKAVQAALKQVKQLSETMEKLKGEAATAKKSGQRHKSTQDAKEKGEYWEGLTLTGCCNAD
jgi:hypothetical protein